jgi:hypothetical protein
MIAVGERRAAGYGWSRHARRGRTPSRLAGQMCRTAYREAMVDLPVPRRGVDAVAATPSYRELIDRLQRRIRESQARAARALNTELVMLYWSIGRDIVAQQQAGGWGDDVVGRIADDLRAATGSARGFSRRNLFYMRRFAALWPDAKSADGVCTNWLVASPGAARRVGRSGVRRFVGRSPAGRVRQVARRRPRGIFAHARFAKTPDAHGAVSSVGADAFGASIRLIGSSGRRRPVAHCTVGSAGHKFEHWDMY